MVKRAEISQENAVIEGDVANDWPTSQRGKSVYEEIFFEVLPPSLKAVTRYNVPLKELTGEKTRLVLDYLIVWHGRKIAVEIDGHRSHYKDPAQIERDDRKDALCKKHGILLFRITGRLMEHGPIMKRLVKKWVFFDSKIAQNSCKPDKRRKVNAN